MRVAIADIETSNFNADNGIILAVVIKEYGKRNREVFRADKYRAWKNNRTNDAEITKNVLEALDKYDIVVFHNGEWFDKGFLNAKAIEHGLRPVLRLKKSIDPVIAARRHLKVGRRSLAALIDYFDISYHKTPMKLKYWLKATLEGDKKCMEYIVRHCVKDVDALEELYDKLRPLIDRIDNKGSAY